MKKSNFLFVSLVSVLLCGTSCSNDTDMDEISPTAVQENNQDEPHICTFDFVNAKFLEESDTLSPKPKAAIERDYKWQNGETIRVKFLNGDSFLQNKVKKYANQWMQYANIRFEYVESYQYADIKVAFKWRGDEGSWSLLGTICRYQSQNEPSTNFGWFSRSTAESEFSRTILHEFGHALGLGHEHQHPLNDIKWNKPLVYMIYAQQGWNKEMVDRNLFEKLSKNSTNYSAYDKNSIMHYPIERYLTTNGYSVGWNTVLSYTDKSFISQEYPFR